MKNIIPWSLVVLALVLVLACGGGGGEPSSPTLQIRLKAGEQINTVVIYNLESELLPQDPLAVVSLNPEGTFPFTLDRQKSYRFDFMSGNISFLSTAVFSSQLVSGSSIIDIGQANAVTSYLVWSSALKAQNLKSSNVTVEVYLRQACNPYYASSYSSSNVYYSTYASDLSSLSLGNTIINSSRFGEFSYDTLYKMNMAIGLVARAGQAMGQGNLIAQEWDQTKFLMSTALLGYSYQAPYEKKYALSSGNLDSEFYGVLSSTSNIIRPLPLLTEAKYNSLAITGTSTYYGSYYGTYYTLNSNIILPAINGQRGIQYYSNSYSY